ncbi:type I DNA topoisomerase [Marinobacter sp. MBR-105]
MPHTLVIVESPAKAKKIGQLLGGDYTVKASVGHIRDLPEKSLGVDLDSMKPHYEVSPGKKETVNSLKRLAKIHRQILLATDLDREGEAIAWHLKVTLGLQPGTYKRVVYGEITRSALLEALSQPRDIDMNRVSAQEARRVLDRLIGYVVSPALSQQAGKALSAGRVQSVAVRFVVERERQIQNFKPEPFYGLVMTLSDHKAVKAALHLKPWAEDEKHIWDRSYAESFCGPQSATLAKVETKPKVVKPRAPLTTVEMQSAGGKIFGLSSDAIMKAAQSLFEKGHITYHRTDNPNLSDEGFEKIQSYLSSQGLPYSTTKPSFPSKADAQEAHEAIRPTDIAIETVGDSEVERQVYSLIRERALLMAMPPGQDDVTMMVFQSSKKLKALSGQLAHPAYIANGKVVRELGWRAHAKVEPIKAEDSLLPALTPGAQFQAHVDIENKKTQPPGRYTEGSLIKTLEAAGIGRPSTYSAIIKNITGRGYIRPLPVKGKKKEAQFEPGDLGYYVVDALTGMGFMNYKYTQQVEASFDKIAKGQMGYVNIVRPVYQKLEADLATHLSGKSLVKTADCPLCSKPLVQKSKRGKASSMFWVHKSDADGESCITFVPDQNGVPVKPAPKVSAQCPGCGNEVHQKSKNSNVFWVHADRSEATACGITFLNDVDGAPSLPEKPKSSTCLQCGETIVRKYSRKNSSWFWVHQTDDPSCGNKYIDDKDGVPVFTATA